MTAFLCEHLTIDEATLVDEVRV